MQRYLSVCYPLRKMKVNSPYGYRTDPFTGKRKFHNGIDLHARGDKLLAMMEGTVIKVGQDRASGKYVVLRHGEFTVSYCHLSRKRGCCPSEGCGRHYGKHGTQHRRASAHHLQAQREECESG